jgi:hypothetical protein
VETTSSARVTAADVDGFVARYGDAWRARDPARIVAECTQDVCWQVAGIDEPLRGRAAVTEWLEGFFRMVPEAEFHYPFGPPFVATNGSAAAARFRFRGIMRGPMEPQGFAPTDGAIDDEGIELYERFEGGRLARCTIVFDQLHVARQIGAAPARGSRAERLGVLVQRRAARRRRRTARRVRHGDLGG